MASLLRPLYWIVWSSPRRRAQKLLEFSRVEAAGGRDLVRAAELTGDPVLRRLFQAHARDEQRHAQMFRARGLELGATFSQRPEAGGSSWIAPGERGLDDLDLKHFHPAPLLAFLHLSESAAARDFAVYCSVLGRDPATRDLFRRIVRDEEHHMRYSLAQLDRIAPRHRRSLLWQARLRRLWKAYLRLASAAADAISTVLLTIQYFVLLPPFALLAKLALLREEPGWTSIPAASDKAAEEGIAQ